LFEDIPFKNIQTFEYEDLAYNVTKSIYYDQHELIDKKIIIPVMVDIDQLPIILLNDAVVKYFGFQVGDVIKITRRYNDINLLNQIDIGYRVVTHI
jgi:DNA-directed RNA polymerase subunit H (RpoH/RPB5)